MPSEWRHAAYARLKRWSSDCSSAVPLFLVAAALVQSISHGSTWDMSPLSRDLYLSFLVTLPSKECSKKPGVRYHNLIALRRGTEVVDVCPALDSASALFRVLKACDCMRACLVASHGLTFFTVSNRSLRSSMEMRSRGGPMPGLFWSHGKNNPPSTVGVSPVPPIIRSALRRSPASAWMTAAMIGRRGCLRPQPFAPQTRSECSPLHSRQSKTHLA